MSSLPLDITAMITFFLNKANVYTVINQTFIEKSPISSEGESKLIQAHNSSVLKTTNFSTVKPISNICPPLYNCLNGGYCMIDETVGPKCYCPSEYEGINCGQSMAKIVIHFLKTSELL